MRTRVVYTYRYTLSIAENMLRSAKEHKHQDYCISTIVFCAFSIEGYLNHVGQVLFDGRFDEFEKQKWREKLEQVLENLLYDADFSKRPFQSIKSMFQIRDMMAHPKTSILCYEKGEKLNNQGLKVANGEWKADRWETFCTLENSERLCKDVVEIIAQLDSLLPNNSTPNFILSEHI